MDYYKLDGHKIVKCKDVIEWGEYMETADRHVNKEDVGDKWVSTVFLGLDHNRGFGPEPLLFETMIFGPDNGGELYGRVSGWVDAERMHKVAVEETKRENQSRAH